MSSGYQDVIERLAATDPAAELRLDETVEAEVWSLVAGAIGRSAVRRRSRSSRGQRLRRGAVVAFAAVLALAGVAFASGLVQIGSPAKTFEGFASASSGFGAVLPESVKVLPVAAPDPQGGPPWGMRVFATSRGIGCIQVGRLVDGRIGVLGQDGAFGDDGRFHELPVRSTSELTCSALDANGHIFNNISKSDQLANGLTGPEQAPSAALPHPQEVCVPSIATQFEKSSVEGRICPQSQERDLYYGLLGPDAKSLTYTSDGKSMTVPTSGPEGAYLIVTAAASGQAENAYGPGAAGLVPVDGPITEIQYSNGAVCQLTGQDGSEDACTQALREPVGYVPAQAPPTQVQVLAPVHLDLTQVTGGRYEATVSFTSQIAVNGGSMSYSLEWKQPGGATGNAAPIEASAAAGQEVTASTGPLPAGVSEVTVTLHDATGPALLEGPGTLYFPVGHGTVAVP
jgi:hypothetical protein